MSPDPRKVEALQNVTPPTNVSEVRSLLSSAAFVQDLSETLQALPNLSALQRTRAGVKWQWTEEEQLSFDHLKAALSTKTTLDTLILRNRRPCLSMVAPLISVLSWPKKTCWRWKWHRFTTRVVHLLQPKRDILRQIAKLFQSTGRSSVFIYLYMAQISKSWQTTSLLWPCLITHLPNHPSKLNASYSVDLQQYRFTVEYRPGPSSTADYPSRHPVEDPEYQNFEDESEEHILFIAKNGVPKAVT